LAKEAEARFSQMRLTNIVQRVGDGTFGWNEQAPFDRIILTASASARPDHILAQLKPGGIAIAPVDGTDQQTLMRYDKGANGEISETPLFDVRFVPLVPGQAKAL
jgi:protein-L-isoaspartate(D-aspartate) O-methyltransferase